MNRIRIQEGVYKTAKSPITGVATLYVLTTQLVTTEPTDYDLNVLRNAYNDRLIADGIDAHCDQVYKIRATGMDNLLADTWVATESPIIGTTAAMIILAFVAVALSAAILISAAAAFVERVFPQTKLYAPDGHVSNSLAEHVTYMESIYGAGKVCHYCGQPFNTVEERQAHEAQCPWRGGLPGPEAPGYEVIKWVKWLIIGVITISGIYVVSQFIPKFMPKRAE